MFKWIPAFAGMTQTRNEHNDTLLLPYPPHPLKLPALVGPHAMLECKPRQARKGAAVVFNACAVVRLISINPIEYDYEPSSRTQMAPKDLPRDRGATACG